MNIFGRIFLPIVIGFFFLLFSITLGGGVFASEGLLKNSDFEELDGGNFSSWQKNYSTLKISATDSGQLVQSGKQSLFMESSSSSTKYLYQIVTATPSAKYRLTVWGKSLFGTASAYLRATVCSTPECSSGKEEIKSFDSSHEAFPFEKVISMEFVTSTNASSLKLKLSLDPVSASESAMIWDKSLLEVVALPEIATDSITKSPVSTISADVPASSVSASQNLNLPTVRFSTPDNVPGDDSFNVPFQLINFSPSTKYFLKTLGGAATESANLRSVSTQNASGSGFLAWNGSWLSMPFVITDINGSGSGTLVSRFNSATSVVGPNLIFLRLRKEDSETNFDSEFQKINVVISETKVTQNEVSSNSNTETLTPHLQIHFEPVQSIETPFKVKVSAKNLAPQRKYHLKIRIRSQSGTFTSGATKNDGVWLSDGDVWRKFPILEANNEGKWEGEVEAKIKKGKFLGKYFLNVRIRDIEENSNHDSGAEDLEVKNNDVKVASSAAVVSQVKSGSSVSAETLGVQTNSEVPLVGKINIPKEYFQPQLIVANSKSKSFLGRNLILAGLTVLGFSVLFYVETEFNLHKKLPKIRKPDSVFKQSSIFARLL